MNSLRKSVGKIFLAFQAAVYLGCAGASYRDAEPSPAAKVQEELEDEISLKADRSHLEELRKDVPEDKKQANDELALIVQLLNDTKLAPSDIQSRYQRTTHKHRDKFRKKVKQLRESFNKVERKKRDEFIREQKQARDKFMKTKADRERSKEFFDEQDLKRREFFANASDRRKEFEDEIKIQSKDFDSHMRERGREFNEQFRLYTRRYHQKQREEREAAKAAAKSNRTRTSPASQQVSPSTAGQSSKGTTEPETTILAPPDDE